MTAEDHRRRGRELYLSDDLHAALAELGGVEEAEREVHAGFSTGPGPRDTRLCALPDV